MKRKNLIILCFSTLLFLVAIGFLEPEPQPNTEVNIPLSAVVKQEGRQEKITCWADAAGGYYLFLPGYAQLDSVSLQPQSPDVRIDGKLVEKGMSCENLSLDVSYSLSFDTSQGRIATVLTLMQSQNLPAIYVDTLSGSMELVHRDKGNQEQGTMRLYLPDGQLDSEGNLESVKGRGNSSWLQEKRPYSLTLHAEADLLGMGQAKNWILLANAMDPSHLRNKVAYDLAVKAGMAYSPESRWVDLYLNGEYAGVYLLSERNEIHSERLDLPLVGSFLVSRESGWRLISQNYPHIITDSGAALRIHDSGLTRTDLDEVWQSVENAILAEEGIDPVTGKSWQELIDMDSWVMEYLMGEVFGNVDAGTISAYFYKDGRDPSGKIYAGPVWDYDLSMGSRNTWQTQFTQVFYADKAHIWNLEDTTWIYWLNRKPEFQNRVQELYKVVFRPLMQELLETGLEDYRNYLSGSVLLDQRRWNGDSALDETNDIRQYLAERMDFLDQVWVEEIKYHKVLVLLDENSSSICHAVLPGETIPELPAYEPSWDILGWYDAETEEVFDPSQPIHEDTIVYLKKIPGEEDRISPLQAVPIVAILGMLALAAIVDRKYCRI